MSLHYIINILRKNASKIITNIINDDLLFNETHSNQNTLLSKIFIMNLN